MHLIQSSAMTIQYQLYTYTNGSRFLYEDLVSADQEQIWALGFCVLQPGFSLSSKQEELKIQLKFQYSKLVTDVVTCCSKIAL